MPGNSDERHRHIDMPDMDELARRMKSLEEIVENLSETIHGNGDPEKFERSIQYRLSQLEKVVSRGLKMIYASVVAAGSALLNALWGLILAATKKP